MNLLDFMEEYGGLTQERKRQAFQVLFTELLSDLEKYDDILWLILEDCELEEAEDRFGTEGLNV